MAHCALEDKIYITEREKSHGEVDVMQKHISDALWWEKKTSEGILMRNGCEHLFCERFGRFKTGSVNSSYYQT